MNNDILRGIPVILVLVYAAQCLAAEVEAAPPAAVTAVTGHSGSSVSSVAFASYGFVVPDASLDQVYVALPDSKSPLFLALSRGQ